MRAFYLLAVALLSTGCAPKLVSIPMMDYVCALKDKGRTEGMAFASGRPILAEPLVQIGAGRYAERAWRQNRGGEVRLMCSRTSEAPPHCLPANRGPDDYGFTNWAMSAVPKLDLPVRPDDPPTRVDVIFTLVERHTSTCDDPAPAKTGP